jgi:hypothetical protein
MKVLAFTIALLLFCGIVQAEISPFAEIGTGHFAGKYAVNHHGNQIAIAYNNNPGNDPDLSTEIILKHSMDDGQTWSFYSLPLSEPCLTQPSILRDGQLLVVSYMDGFERKLSILDTWGGTWSHFTAGRSFENNPIVYFDNGVYRSYSLDLPYPQWKMEEFHNQLNGSDYIVPQGYTFNPDSINGTGVRFGPYDYIGGPYRTNGDIFVDCSASLAPSNCPVFEQLAMCSGELGGTYSGSDLPIMFPAGILENVPELELPRLDLSAYQPVGPVNYDPSKIVMVNVQGSTYEAWLGSITPPELVPFEVYNVYPDIPLDEPIFTNMVALRDTIWTPLPGGNCANTQLYSANRLWIKGNFAGKQNWACGDTIYIIGDITLAGTPPGESPLEPLNTTDKVSLISEKSVLVKYGYLDPVSGIRVHIARQDADPIKIYASVFALGNNPANPRKNGVFSFEYQHPHPSVPAVHSYGGQTWDYIDLHRRKFPQTLVFPWPEHVDYPWYNPLWPERSPYLERGTLQVWGSMIQHTRGYMHRSLYDVEWNGEGAWNIDMDYCGGSSALVYEDPALGWTLNSVNYPGAPGSGIGYKKDYRYDSRIGFKDATALIWPFGPKISALVYYGQPTLSDEYICRIEEIENPQIGKQFAQGTEFNLLSLNNHLYKQQGNSLTELGYEGQFGMINGLALGTDNLGLVSEILVQTGEGGDYSFHVSLCDASTGTVQPVAGFGDLESTLFNVAVLPGNRKILAYLDNQEQLQILDMENNGELHHAESCDLSWLPEDFNRHNSRLELIPAGTDQLDIVLWLSGEGMYTDFPAGLIHHARASLQPVDNDDPVLPVPQMLSLSAYPNPARDNMKLELSSTQGECRLDVFNLRGQKLCTLQSGSLNDRGGQVYNWDGRDAMGYRLGSGVYLIKARIEDRTVLTKRVCLY